MGFVNERTVKAVRKPGRCDACCILIAAGEPAVRWVGVVDGDFHNSLYHPDCREAEVALNRLHDTDFHPDEWMSLTADMESDDHPWLLEYFPAVAARMNINETTIADDAAEREACRLAWAKAAAKPAGNPA